jgi:hypothetical protein
MHFDFLIEDISGKKLLEEVAPKILEEEHTYTVHAYRGIGRLPKNLNRSADPSKRILLDQIPRIIRGLGKTYASYAKNYHATAIVVCDLDHRNKQDFLAELMSILDNCNPAPTTIFALAVEEGESWMLGDINAIKTAYPNAKDQILRAYINDSICGTWETLADAVYPGGAQILKTRSYQIIGKEKFEWASKIAPHMDISNNNSPSFNEMLTEIQNALRIQD